MTEDNTLSDQELDDLFAAEAADTPEPSQALMQRIINDADRVSDARLMAERPTKAAQRPGFISSLVSAIGGWPGIAGLTTATVVGIWIGFSPPAAIDGLAGYYLADNSYFDLGDFMPPIDELLDEG